MRGERKRETLNLGARALPAEVGAHGHLCTRSRYRLTLNQPERQVPWKAACSLRCSPASLILLSWPLVFLLPRLSFWKRLPCTGQSTAVWQAHPCQTMLSALRFCSRQPRWLAAKVFRVAGPHSLHCLCLHASVQLHQHANALGAVPGTSRSSQPFSRAADTLRMQIMRSCFCRCGKHINQPEGTKWRAPAR